MVNKQTRHFLVDFGLNETEIQLYFTLLTLGPSSIMGLSRESNIKRSTTHNNVEGLIDKGLVTQTTYGERRMVVAEEPEKLRFLMEEKKWTVKKMEDQLGDIITQIEEFIPNKHEPTIAQVKHYEGERRLSLVFKDILGANEVRSFLNLDKMHKFFPDSSSLSKKALTNNSKMKMWCILQDSRKDREKLNNIHVRYNFKFVPQNNSLFDTSFIVFDNSIAIINVDKEVPSCILINSKESAKGFSTIHKIVWDLLEK